MAGDVFTNSTALSILLILLVAAVFTDLRTHRIPNVLVFPALALSLLVFVVYNVIGIVKQGPIHYFAHFAGPKFELGGINARWIAPLMFPIEIASHLARPVSLPLRQGCLALGSRFVHQPGYHVLESLL